MKVELEEVYRLINDDIERGKEIAWPEEYREGRNKSLEILREELRANFPEYVICFGNINRRFGTALAVLSNDTTDLHDVRMLRLTDKQARKKLEKDEIVFSKNELKEYVNCLNAREKAIVYKSTLGKQSFIDMYLPEEATADDE